MRSHGHHGHLSSGVTAVLGLLCAMGCRAGMESAPAAGAAGAEAPPPGDPVGERAVRDRCLGRACEPVALPEQPDLPFFEDMGDGWRRLVELDWALSAGTEGYRCATLTLPQDVAIAAYYPQDPPGTHHVTGSIIEAPREPDRVYACSPTQPGGRRLPGSGAGTDPYEYPDGVYLPLHAGEQLHIQLHLFNPSDEPLSGRSGLWVRERSTGERQHVAEAALVGPLSLNIPAGRSMQAGACALPADTTVFSLRPHMHQLGTHMRVIAAIGDRERVLLDAPYDFAHQLEIPIEPTSLSAGDQIRVECSYDNDTGRTVGWGDSSNDEMCFIGMSMYPPAGFGTVPCF